MYHSGLFFFWDVWVDEGTCSDGGTAFFYLSGSFYLVCRWDTGERIREIKKIEFFFLDSL